MTVQRGKFITIEGPDGAGKTSQIPVLVNALKANGFEVIQSREPGGTQLGERIRDLLLGRVGAEAPMNWKTELLLFAAARAQHVEQLIKPALAAGKMVVCDRFMDSSFAYQGGGRGFKADVEELERFVLRGFEPDFTLFFDVTLEASLQRLCGRSDEINTFDALSRDFKVGTYNAYKERFQKNPHRMVRINAMGTIGNVEDQINDWVNNKLVPQIKAEHFETPNLQQHLKS